MARTSFFSGGEVLSEPNCNPRASLGLDWGEAFFEPGSVEWDTSSKPGLGRTEESFEGRGRESALIQAQTEWLCLINQAHTKVLAS